VTIYTFRDLVLANERDGILASFAEAGRGAGAFG